MQETASNAAGPGVPARSAQTAVVTAVPPGGGGPGPDTTAPLVSRFRLTNNPFVVRRAAAKPKKHKKGTAFRYTLSEAASVKIVIAQRRAGRRKGRRCVAPTKKLRRAKKCTRITRKGTLRRASRQGANTVAFSGQIGGKALRPGRYQATLTATDAAGNASIPKRVLFRIVKR